MTEQEIEKSTIKVDPRFTYQLYKSPVYTWECDCFGCNRMGVVIQVEDHNVPNWFWRKMQYLFFGNKWEKL